jgi:hypothetical protein
MKIKTISLFSLLIGLTSTGIAQASSYEEAVTEATAAIDQAKAVNYEWRDSRKLLEQADKLQKEGKSNDAMMLVLEAREQGRQAVIQAKMQSGVSGPH